MASYSEQAKDPEKPAEPKKGQDKDEILRVAKKQYEEDWQAEEHNINAAHDDLRFLTGDQWLEMVKKERTGEGRIMLTHNRLSQFIRQITGDMRLNKLAIKVRPAGGVATEDVANIQTGLIRNIEAQSGAPNVYVLAGTDAARAGWGVFRITTEYADVDMFEQDIRIRHVVNPLGVLFDCNATMPTREDARHCFVPTRMTYEAFQDAYPDALKSTWDEMRPLGLSELWADPREIVVCEYWCKKREKRTLVRMGDGSTFLADNPPRMFKGQTPEQLKAAATKTREVEVDCVYQYIMTGAEILDGPTKWAGRYIPIIPVIGEEIAINDKVIRHGAIRWAKDPQRMYNMHITTATEAHALAPKAPFVGTAEQFKGFEKEWRQANKRNLPYLRFNPDPQAPTLRPERSQVSTDIGSSMALAQAAVDDMHSTVGIYPPALGQKSNETSGKAILARQREGDVGTYLYIDNLAQAIQYAGRQLIDLIPHIYDTERVVRIVHEDDTTELVDINKFDQAQSKVLNDVTVGKYDVVVDVGPAFSTRRAEAAEAMMNFVNINPQSGALFLDLIADANDWPLKDKFIERAKALLPPGVDPEVDAERQARAGPPQPNPAEEIMLRQEAAEAEKTENESVGVELDNMKKAAELPYAAPQAAQSTRNMAMPKPQPNGKGK